ncbi:MAG: hypothetical protein R2692_03220 [Microbacterium sp.]
MSSHTFDDPYGGSLRRRALGLDELAPPDDDDRLRRSSTATRARSRSTREAVPGHAVGPSAGRATGTAGAYGR